MMICSPSSVILFVHTVCIPRCLSTPFLKHYPKHLHLLLHMIPNTFIFGGIQRVVPAEDTSASDVEKRNEQRS